MIEAARRLNPATPVFSVREFTLDAPIMVRSSRSESVTVEAERLEARPGDREMTVATRIRRAGNPVHAAVIALGEAAMSIVPWKHALRAGASSVSRGTLYTHPFKGHVMR
jgi:hypothetical protein